MSLESALKKVDAGVAAFEKILADNPQDPLEASERVQKSSLFFDEAMTEGIKLREPQQSEFLQKFSEANERVEHLETLRIKGLSEENNESDEEEGEEPVDEVQEPEVETPSTSSSSIKSQLYSSLARDNGV